MKNTSIGYISFELNCGFYFKASYKKDIDPCSQSRSINKLITKLKELIIIYKKNFQYTQKLQKQYYNKDIKLKCYTPSKNIWFNSRFIKTKNRNRKLEAKFFNLFRLLYSVGKQAYKLELPNK